MAESDITLIAVVGPTACGKTDLAVSLCERLGGEAVSCDSMQIYTGMPIATAQPSEQEMRGIPHHLMNYVGADEVFSVARYCEQAKLCIADICARGRLPVLVGGTGLYYSSLVDNISFVQEKSDLEYRSRLKERAQREGAQKLLDELRLIDPESAAALHANNVGRVIRALEIYHSTGLTKTQQEHRSRLQPSPFRPCVIGLDARSRDYLYSRINRRVDAMLENGLLDEAREFYKLHNAETASQAIGFKELKPYLDGKESLEQGVERLRQQTRRYAKRQLTWFRRDERVNWLYIDEYGSSGELVDAAMKIIEREGVLG